MENNNRGQPWWDDRTTVNINCTEMGAYDENLFISPKSVYSYLEETIEEFRTVYGPLPSEIFG